MSTSEGNQALSDPVLAILAQAPLVEETPEEAALFEEALPDIRAGRSVSSDAVQRMLAERSDGE